VRSGTTPLDSTVRGVAVDRLRVSVVEGPDAGASAVGERVTVGTADGNDLILGDPTVSRYHLEIARTSRGARLVDLESTNGTFAEGVFVERGMVRIGSAVRVGRTKLQVDDAEAGTVDLYDGSRLAGVIGQSRAMRELMARVAKAAPTSASILLVGESGSGKEVIARAIHDLSERAASPYEIVDCATLAPQLVASELFGHEKGAFTGAHARHVGAFERASGGTLFLDEIGELPAELQSHLLGALERRQFRRVGGREPLSVDVRVVAATNRDLRAEVNANAFRLDLYYRLAVLHLEVPPLRARPEDVPLLAEHFVRELGDLRAVEEVFTPEGLEQMKRHRWPGNVRELRNFVEATMALGELPRMEEGPAPVASGEGAIDVAPLLGLTYKEARQRAVMAFEARFLASLLERAEGNVSAAARLAKMDRSYLFSLMKKHGMK